MHQRFRRFLTFWPVGSSELLHSRFEASYKVLREKGLRALNFLDDWCVWAGTFLACLLAVWDIF